MFSREHYDYAHREATAASKSLLWRVFALGGGGALAAVNVPFEWAGKIACGAAGAIIGGGLLYGLPWAFHLMESINAVHGEHRRERRRLQRESKRTVRIATEALQGALEAVKREPSALEVWTNETAPDVRAAVIAMLIPANGKPGGMTVGAAMSRLSIDAGSIGIQHGDLREIMREPGGASDWNAAVVCMRYLVAQGILAPAGDRPFEDTSICVLTDLGRRALIAFGRFPMEHVENYRRQKADERPDENSQTS